MVSTDYVLSIWNYASTWYFYSPIARPRNPRNILKKFLGLLLCTTEFVRFFFCPLDALYSHVKKSINQTVFAQFQLGKRVTLLQNWKKTLFLHHTRNSLNVFLLRNCIISFNTYYLIIERRFTWWNSFCSISAWQTSYIAPELEKKIIFASYKKLLKCIYRFLGYLFLNNCNWEKIH